MMATLPDPLASATPLTPARLAHISNKLNLRSMPSLMGTRLARLEPGQALLVDQVLEGEAFLGRTQWLRVANQQQYFWAGGARLDEAPVATPQPAAGEPAPDVRRRSNGSILPLSQADLAGVFGAFQSQPGAKRGAVVISTPGWVQQHIVALQHPLLEALGQGSVAVHRLALPHFQAVFDAIAQAGLADLLLTFDGSFVPRHKNWDPNNPELSSHSWGVAIDINARWNPAGSAPALPGRQGFLGDLVPLFNARGFAWGGHFTNNPDGMHFELARRDP